MPLPPLPTLAHYRGPWTSSDTFGLACILLLLATLWLTYMIIHLRTRTPFFWGKRLPGITATIPTSIAFVLILTANALLLFYLRTDTTIIPHRAHPLFAIPSILAMVACPLYDYLNSR